MSEQHYSQLSERTQLHAGMLQKHGELIEKLDGSLRVMAESIRLIEKRLTDSDGLNKSIHDLALSIALHSKQVDHLSERIDSRMALIEERQTKQGERIGALEIKPAKKWEIMVSTIITGLVTAGIGIIIGYLINR